MKRQFLIVTNDTFLSRSIGDCFTNDQSIELNCTTSLSQALFHITRKTHCLLMVDLQCPNVDPVEMVRIFRVTKHFPILALTEPLSVDEKISFFHAGVDVFLDKPINAEVCLAQANALVELYVKTGRESSESAPVTFGTSILVAPRYRQVFLDGESLELTRREFDLLYFLQSIRARYLLKTSFMNRFGIIFMNWEERKR